MKLGCGLKARFLHNGKRYLPSLHFGTAYQAFGPSFPPWKRLTGAVTVAGQHAQV